MHPISQNCGFSNQVKMFGINDFYWSKRLQPRFISKDLWEPVNDGYNLPFDEVYKALDANAKCYILEYL